MRGHHVYKTSWTPEIHEELCCNVEEENSFDRHAVAVIKDGRVAGHVPQKLARLLSVKTTQQNDMQNHGPQKTIGDQRKRPCRSVYIHFQWQRKTCPETDISFYLASYLLYARARRSYTCMWIAKTWVGEGGGRVSEIKYPIQ